MSLDAHEIELSPRSWSSGNYCLQDSEGIPPLR